MKEKDYYSLLKKKSFRPMQVPLRKTRFLYLTDNSIPKENEQWILLHYPNHFSIYHKESETCVFDAIYIQLRDRDSLSDEDEIAAVITYMRTNTDVLQITNTKDPTGWDLFISLIEKDL